MTRLERRKRALLERAIDEAQDSYADDYEYGISDSDMQLAIKAAMKVLDPKLYESFRDVKARDTWDR